jgi:hypothetical protein
VFLSVNKTYKKARGFILKEGHLKLRSHERCVCLKYEIMNHITLSARPEHANNLQNDEIDDMNKHYSEVYYYVI